MALRASHTLDQRTSAVPVPIDDADCDDSYDCDADCADLGPVHTSSQQPVRSPSPVQPKSASLSAETLEELVQQAASPHWDLSQFFEPTGVFFLWKKKGHRVRARERGGGPQGRMRVSFPTKDGSSLSRFFFKQRREPVLLFQISRARARYYLRKRSRSSHRVFEHRARKKSRQV